MNFLLGLNIILVLLFVVIHYEVSGRIIDLDRHNLIAVSDHTLISKREITGEIPYAKKKKPQARKGKPRIYAQRVAG